MYADAAETASAVDAKVHELGFELWVYPEPYTGKDTPLGPTPEIAGLKPEKMYRVIGMSYDAEPDTEAFVIVVNEVGEIWFISNRHVRVAEALKEDAPVYLVRDKHNFSMF